MKLTAANTAIVLDSTADFPDARERFPNWRVVPLYVRFGDESFRDGVDLTPAEFYARLRGVGRAADDVAADAGRLPRRATRSSPATSGSSRSTSRAKLSGTFAERRRPRRRARRRRVRTIDSETASAAIAMLALAIQRRLERGTTDEEIDALVERFGASTGCSSPSTRSSSSRAAAASAGRARSPASCCTSSRS